MAKIKSWLGNDTSDFTIFDKELDMIADFCNNHKSVYIFGKGKIGKAFAHYLNESDIVFSGFITSDSLADFKPVYEQNRTGIIIGVRDAVLNEIMPALAEFVSESDVLILPSNYRELMGNQLSVDFLRDRFWVNIFTTNRCNLGCKSCSTFAPVTHLCKINTDYEIDVFEKDIKQLKELNLPQIGCLKFTGGEAFLHPFLFEMFAIARKNFPETSMECYTNGTLLNNLDSAKLSSLRELGVTLTITTYPVEHLDLSGFYKRADEIGVSYQVICNNEDIKYFSKRTLNSDKSTKKYCFFGCPRYKMCDSLFIYKNKLWKCIYSFNHPVLNEAFNTNFKTVDGDYLDLYNTTPDDIYKFAISRIPFCGYCNPITETVPWALSERKIEEWA